MKTFAFAQTVMPAGASKALPAALVAALLAFPGITAQAAEPDTVALGDEVQRFCTNIADEARDHRYALQKQELARLREEVDGRIVALEDKRAEFEIWLDRREAFLDKATNGLVEIYASMRPDAAAERLAEVRVELAAAILMKLKPRDAGVILDEMNSESAAMLTTIIASAARPEDPS
ncbi:MotE family protein [Chelativorans sp. YIM 93263]|uniref:MotE family protein n=1 Tax=Chelativorans sp. YIM 93263 TaxID=2906648 RepID=UPI002378692D|nr:MotE family protein [Chelativorans sp. YIM 93263]